MLCSLISPFFQKAGNAFEGVRQSKSPNGTPVGRDITGGMIFSETHLGGSMLKAQDHPCGSSSKEQGLGSFLIDNGVSISIFCTFRQIVVRTSQVDVVDFA